VEYFFEELSYFCAGMISALLVSLLRFSRIFLLLILLFSSPSCSVYKLCPIPGCQVRMLHSHGGVTYRGQPWWRVKRLNPKVGQQYVYTKDKNLIKIDNWFTRVFGKKPEKKEAEIEGIKARDPNSRHKEKDFDTEEPEEDKEEKEAE
jgi:hypothetical protein